MTGTGSRLHHLSCRACCTDLDPESVRGTCPTCGGTLLAEYSLDGLDGRSLSRAWEARAPGLWRYRELLPVRDDRYLTTLGEPESPRIRLPSPAGAEGLQLWAKDDGCLPTGSFKARGMAVAVSRAAELGVREVFAPSAGNAGVALAAYAARAGLSATVYVPDRTDAGVVDRTTGFGAKVVRVGLTIREAGEEGRRREQGRGFDLSTMREPYRVEGKKTMAFEVAGQFGPDELPDVIVYPTGGGTGLVGLRKGFEELQRIGLVDRLPRLIAVQPDGCAPVVRALKDGSPRATPWAEPHTVAPGLAVPAPFASERILEAVRASHGTGITVRDEQIVRAQRELATTCGVAVAIEAAATWAAVPALLTSKELHDGERVLLYLTGRGPP